MVVFTEATVQIPLNIFQLQTVERFKTRQIVYIVINELLDTSQLLLPVILDMPAVRTVQDG